MTWYYPFVVIAAGALLGLIKFPRIVFRIADYAGNVALVALMLSIGASVGADEKIISNLGGIGLECAVICLFAMFLSILFVILLEKTVLPLESLKKKLLDEKIEAGAEVKIDSEEKRSPLGWIISASIVLGVAAGYFFIPPELLDAVNKCFLVSITILFVTIGVSLSQNRGVFQYIKKLGARVILLPLAIFSGSLIGGGAAALLLGIEPYIAVLSASGMCYYSLTGALMTQAYGMYIGTYGFLVNVFREFLTALLLPLLIKLGKGSPIASGGAADMDVLLVPISKTLGVELGFIALITGIILSFAVPVFFPVLMRVFG